MFPELIGQLVKKSLLLQMFMKKLKMEDHVL